MRAGVRMHYQQVGEGPDLVMVHGITGNLAVWHLHIVPELADHFRMLTYDLRGHGLQRHAAVGLQRGRDGERPARSCSTRSRSSAR